MPVYEPGKKGWGWPAYLAVGCGGCAVLVIIFLVGSTMVGLYFAKKTMNQMMSGSMQGTSRISVGLPDGNGKLTYWFNPLNSSGRTTSSGGIQGMGLTPPHGKPQQWILPFRQHNVAKLDVSWYAAKKGHGPLVRLKDNEDEVLLDVQRHKAGLITRAKGRAYVTNLSPGTSDMFSPPGSSMISTSDQTGDAPKSADGTPAKDVTALLSPTNCQHLGIIVCKGNKLVFVPASGKKP